MSHTCKREKEIRFLAVAMIVTGTFIWFTAGSEKAIFDDINVGVGIFLFIVGFMTIWRGHKLSKDRESTSETSPNES